MMMGTSWGLAGILAPVAMIPMMDRWGYGPATALCVAPLVVAVFAAAALPRSLKEPTVN